MAELLADHTTLRLGGPAHSFVEVDSERALVDAVAAAEREGSPLLVLGAGSNLVVADEGFPGTVIAVRTSGIRAEVDGCGGALVEVAAGETWDDLVVRAQSEGWVGIEALSGIPGLVGAVPIQNVGAYGQEVSQTIASVRTYDRTEHRQVTFAAGDCGFAYRASRFKAEPGRFVVLGVAFQFRLGDLSVPVAYAELARTLGVEVGERLPLSLVRGAVLGLRGAKGMVLDATDHDTWSAGSFFTNPLLDPDVADRLPGAAPRWPQPDGSVKTSAAWLIDQAGYAKGYGDKGVSLSTKHPLALTNRGGARTYDLLELAREIRAGVEAKFGVTLVNEPVTVGCTL